MGKNDKEKQMQYEWGKSNGSNHHFQEIDQEKKSYYIEREAEADRNSYIREYRFETLPEFMQELEELWKNDKVTDSIKKVVGVAAIKNKPVEVTQKIVKEVKKEETEEKLPAFIYNF